MTSGQMNISFVDKDTGNPVRIGMGGFEYRDADLDAMVRVYDPARYANGVGDQV